MGAVEISCSGFCTIVQLTNRTAPPARYTFSLICKQPSKSDKIMSLQVQNVHAYETYILCLPCLSSCWIHSYYLWKTI